MLPVRAQSRGDTIRPWKLVEGSNCVGHHVMDDDAGKPLEWQPMDAGAADALLDRSHITFDFTQQPRGYRQGQYW